MVRVKLRMVLAGGVIAALLLALVPGQSAAALGCPTVRQGSSGDCVRQLQTKLGLMGLLPSTQADGAFGPRTDAAVREFQGRTWLPVDGIVGPQTWAKLDSSTVHDIYAYGFPPVCLKPGIVICVSKQQQKLYAMRDAQVVLALDARFGDDLGPEHATVEGLYAINRKVKDEVSVKYNNAPMPYTNYFTNDGQGIHFSPSFAAGEQEGNTSHGCIRLRDENGAAAIFYYVPIGTPVFIWN